MQHDFSGNNFRAARSSRWKCPYKKFFLKVLQNPQENIRVNKVNKVAG